MQDLTSDILLPVHHTVTTVLAGRLNIYCLQKHNRIRRQDLPTIIKWP